MSMILALEPRVLCKLRSQYPSSKNILSIEDLAQKFLGHSISVLEPLTSLRQSLFPDFHIHPEFDEVAKKYIHLLKSNDVKPHLFLKAVHENCFSSFKKDIFLKIGLLYEAYEKKTKSDSQDVIEFAELSNIEKILLMAHETSELEKKFVGILAQKVPEVTQITLSFLDGEKKKISVIQAPSCEVEVEAIADEIQKQLKKGTPAASIYVFCSNLKNYEMEFKSIFGKRNFPYSFWTNLEQDPEKISILPYTANHLVFGDMKVVFICGLNSHEKDLLWISEEEKTKLNAVLGKQVFQPSNEAKEFSKQLLHWLSSQAQKFYLTSIGTLIPSVQEFLKEYERFSVTVKEPVESAKTPESIPKMNFPKIEKEFLPDTYSIRSLTQYQNCPYGFLIRECFKLSPQMKPTVELNTQEEGVIFHYILYRYFSRTQGHLKDILKEAFLKFSDEFNKEILESDRIRLEQTLEHFLETEKDWQAKSRFTPRFFELSFGFEQHKHFELHWKGKKLKLRGKIDRVDVDEQAKEFRVIDYKTGSSVNPFQLALYSIVVHDLFLPEYFPSQGFFYFIKNADFKKSFEFESKAQWEALKDETLREVFQIADQIQALEFPCTPQDCYESCSLKSMCEN